MIGRTMLRNDYFDRNPSMGLCQHMKGECCWLRERIDITRANQKPLLHIARTNHLAVFDIANKLYTLDAKLEYKQFVLDITSKLYTLDAILEYSLF